MKLLSSDLPNQSKHNCIKQNIPWYIHDHRTEIFKELLLGTGALSLTLGWLVIQWKLCHGLDPPSRQGEGIFFLQFFRVNACEGLPVPVSSSCTCTKLFAHVKDPIFHLRKGPHGRWLETHRQGVVVSEQSKWWLWLLRIVQGLESSFAYIYIPRSNFTHITIGGYATRNSSGGGVTSDRRKIAGVRDFPRV